MTRIAILNDYQGVALTTADWTVLPPGTETHVFREALPADESVQVEMLAPFDIICLMRERTAMPASLLRRLPNLKLIVTTGMGNRVVDTNAARDLGIPVCGTGGGGGGGGGNSTGELLWGLIIGLARNIPAEHQAIREGGWQVRVGEHIGGRTLGVLGLGELGSHAARIARAFDMNVIAWSPNLTAERAREGGAELVSREELFSRADFLSIHMVLSDRSRGMVTAADIARMKPTAYLVNTSRGPIVDQDALVRALQEKRIAGAALDVFDPEPLPVGHPLRTLDNVVLTPHIGFVTKHSYHGMFRDTVEDIQAFLRGEPIRVINAQPGVPD